MSWGEERERQKGRRGGRWMREMERKRELHSRKKDKLRRKEKREKER